MAKPNHRHKKKYKSFIEACKDKTPTILVSGLHILWDNIEEIECNMEIARENGKDIVCVENWIIIRDVNKI